VIRGARCADGKIRLNLGCGGSPLEGYINVDMDSLDELKTRYPSQHFAEGLQVHDYDIFPPAVRRRHRGRKYALTPSLSICRSSMSRDSFTR